MVIAPPEPVVAEAPARPAEPSQRQLLETFTRLAPPGRKCRYDAAGLGDYKDTLWWKQILLRVPTTPFAVPLASVPKHGHRGHNGRYYLVCFDLDVRGPERPPRGLDEDQMREWYAEHGTGLGPAGVDEDAERLIEWLDAAEIRYLVAQSSPAGGRHVWIATPGGVGAAEVKALARALKPLLPTLDHGMLCNPKTGCVRPPGAPHRSGGRSVIDRHAHPDPAAALAAFAEGNDPDTVDRLMAQLPAPTVAAAADGKSADRPLSVDDEGHPCLARPRRELSPRVAELAHTAPAPAEDASARLFSIALGAAFAGWTYAEFAQLCRTAPGAIHLRSRRVTGHPTDRLDRPQQQREALCAQQWARAVERAQSMPLTAVPAGEEDTAWDERCQKVMATVTAVLDCMAAEPERFATPGGPTDELVLRALLRRALRATTLTIGASDRSLAEECGIAASTAALALARLSRTTLLDGPAWIDLETPHRGRNSAVWRLLPQAAPAENTHDHQAEYLPVDVTRTQGTPRGLEKTGRAKRALSRRLDRALELSSHDLWHGHRGLGHHVSRTYGAIMTWKDPETTLLATGPSGPPGLRDRLTLPLLASLTGYTTATCAQHLRLLAQHRLVVLSRLPDRTMTVRSSGRALGPAAAALGSAGAGAARAARHAIERETWHWRLDEQAWRSAPNGSKPRGVPTDFDPHRAPAEWGEDDRRWRYGRFPVRTVAGRPRADWAAARRTVATAILND